MNLSESSDSIDSHIGNGYLGHKIVLVLSSQPIEQERVSGINTLLIQILNVLINLALFQLATKYWVIVHHLEHALIPIVNRLACHSRLTRLVVYSKKGLSIRVGRLHQIFELFLVLAYLIFSFA